jgi:hypothetical protein
MTLTLIMTMKSLSRIGDGLVAYPADYHFGLKVYGDESCPPPAESPWLDRDGDRAEPRCAPTGGAVRSRLHVRFQPGDLVPRAVAIRFEETSG